MNRCLRIALLFAWTLAFVQADASPSPKLERFEASHEQMGTQFRLVFYTHAPEEAESIAAKAFSRIDALNTMMSDYIPDSELSMLSEIAGTQVAATLSDDLAKVLQQSLIFSLQSDGAFDVTVGPFMHLWRSSRRQGRLPHPERLEATRESVGYQHLHLDESEHSIRLDVPGMKLDLGGIAKGYAVDQALAVLEAHGVKSALVDGGGDIRVSAAPPGEKGWNIRLSHFHDEDGGDSLVSLTDCAVATSGDRFKFIEIEGQRYSHLIDPSTGLGLTTLRSVTVIAGDAMTADALASTFSILNPEASRELLESHYPEASAIVATKNGEELSGVVLGDFPGE